MPLHIPCWIVFQCPAECFPLNRAMLFRALCFLCVTNDIFICYFAYDELEIEHTGI